MKTKNSKTSSFSHISICFKKNITLFAIFFSFSFLFLGQETTQIGNGTINDYDMPFYGLWDYSHEMLIFTEAEIGPQSKEIFELEFDLNSYDFGYTFNDVSIKLAHVKNDFFDDNTQVDLSGLDVSDLTTVISNRDVVFTQNGWYRFTFDNSFEYKGSGNLLVIIENRDGSWQGGYGYAESNNDLSGKKGWFAYQDDFYPQDESLGTTTYSRPNIKFSFFNNNPLPINLISFEGELLSSSNENLVELQWETASEHNNDYYTIHRSLDGVSWEIIASINGAGNSTEKISYSTLDRMLSKSLTTEFVYYRLSQTDFDGESESFDPISVRLSNPRGRIIKQSTIIGQKATKDTKGLILERYENGTTIKRFQ